MRFGGR